MQHMTQEACAAKRLVAKLEPKPYFVSVVERRGPFEGRYGLLT
jgi:hypothetical protein